MPTWLLVLAAVIVLAVIGLSSAEAALGVLGAAGLVIGLLGLVHGRTRTRA